MKYSTQEIMMCLKYLLRGWDGKHWREFDDAMNATGFSPGDYIGITHYKELPNPPITKPNN